MVAQVRDIDRKAVMISRRLTALSKKERKLIDRIKRLEKLLRALSTKIKENDCECGIKEDGTWSEKVFDNFGCSCDEAFN